MGKQKHQHDAAGGTWEVRLNRDHRTSCRRRRSYSPKRRKPIGPQTKVLIRGKTKKQSPGRRKLRRGRKEGEVLFDTREGARSDSC